jgi:hypothetical protein
MRLGRQSGGATNQLVRALLIEQISLSRVERPRDWGHTFGNETYKKLFEGLKGSEAVVR